MTASNQRFDPTVNYYAILDLPIDASRAEIVGAYRRLIRSSHPDTVRDVAGRAAAEERAKRLNAAYSVLSRPELRREYDQAMRRTLMAQAVLDRYHRPAPARPIHREPRRHPQRPQPRASIRSAQRSAYRRSLWQLVFAFGGVCVALLLIIILTSLLIEGAQIIF